MSSQVYTLFSPAFAPAESSPELLRLKVHESLRYFLQRLVSCRHRQMGRPFTRDGRTYRSCAKCGTRREFDLETWKMKGRYHPEAVGRVGSPRGDGLRRLPGKRIESLRRSNDGHSVRAMPARV